MTQTARCGSSPITGLRVTALIISWLAVVYLAAPPLALYYETLAAWYVVPPLLLIYAYCLSHRHGASAILAVVATAVALLAIGFAIAIPKAASAAASATVDRSEPSTTAADDSSRSSVGPLALNAQGSDRRISSTVDW